MNLLAIIVFVLLGIQDVDNYELQAVYDYFFAEQERAAYDALDRDWDRDRFYVSFWKKHDPTPESEYNEDFQLFLSRYEYANFAFSRLQDFQDGWKSDMGHVFIIYGAPREIYRSPEGPSLEPKYEVWIYRNGSSDDGGRSVELIFQDIDDDGIFDLQTEVAFANMVQESVLPTVSRQAQIVTDDSQDR